MKGIILVNGFSGIGMHQAKRLQEEFALLEHGLPIVQNKAGAVPLDVDFCIYLDKDQYTAIALENKGVKLFNASQPISVCDDKMLTFLALNGLVKQPRTIPASFCYANVEASEEELDYIEEEIGYPVVVKLNKQSRGDGVFLARCREELRGYVNQFRTIPHLYQKFISFSSGRDTRVIVVGGKVVCAMERVNEKDFRSNVEQGGVGHVVVISDTMRETAEKVSKMLGLDYCGIDFVIDENGEIYLLEVNSNAFFKGIESVSGVNVARAYAKHVLESLNNLHS